MRGESFGFVIVRVAGDGADLLGGVFEELANNAFSLVVRGTNDCDCFDHIERLWRRDDDGDFMWLSLEVEG
jgi:hypothetical protein